MESTDIPDEVIAKLSDYLDGALPADERAEVDRKLADDELWRRAHADLVGTREALSGLQRARAPATFAQDVTQTIHQRSAGRLFARRTAGDHVPLMALVVVVVLGMLVIGFLMWSSTTGSLRDAPSAPEAPGSGSAELVPRP
jgi:anti-sigma factor RsiW